MVENEVGEVARRLSQPMRLLLSRHAEGWRSSLYTPPGSTVAQPYWARMECTYAPPHFHVRDALIRRRLIENYDDAAGITPLGLQVCAAIAKSTGNQGQGDVG